MLNKRFQLNNIDFELEYEIYPINEKYDNQKTHQKVGFAKLIIADLILINKFNIFLNKEKQEHWLASPSIKQKDKYWNVVKIEQELQTEIFNILNNKIEPIKQEKETDNSQGWELDI